MYDELPRGGMDRLTGGLRTQLQEMTAASHALASSLAGNEKAESYLAVLNKGICAQLRLVRRLELDGRLSSPDEIRLRCGPVDLVELCRNLMERADRLTRPLLDIRSEFSTTLTALPTLADKAALEEMLLDFVANGVRAIGRSGTVRLKLERRGNREDQAVFTVTDTGGGLDSAVLAGLFDPEEAQPETPARGLLLARQIAELHGGTLAAGNTEAGSACLVVSIPIVERMGGRLNTPGPRVDAGGWDSALVALSGLLPLQAFRPERRGDAKQAD